MIGDIYTAKRDIVQLITIVDGEPKRWIVLAREGYSLIEADPGESVSPSVHPSVLVQRWDGMSFWCPLKDIEPALKHQQEQEKPHGD